MKIGSAIMLCLFLSCCSGTRPSMLGVKEGKFAPCPGSPNCVSTQAQDDTHRIDPIRYTGTMEQAKQRLIQVISSMRRAKVILGPVKVKRAGSAESNEEHSQSAT